MVNKPIFEPFDVILRLKLIYIVMNRGERTVSSPSPEYPTEPFAPTVKNRFIKFVRKIKYDITITLERKYENTIFGVKKYYTFDYNPINREDYHYSNTDGDLGTVFFLDTKANAL